MSGEVHKIGETSREYQVLELLEGMWPEVEV